LVNGRFRAVTGAVAAPAAVEQLSPEGNDPDSPFRVARRSLNENGKHLNRLEKV
jgi:hypothetical protein